MWIVARCLHHNLKLALAHIEVSKFEAFAPLMTTPKTATCPARIVPVFAGYIFVRRPRVRRRGERIAGNVCVADAAGFMIIKYPTMASARQAAASMVALARRWRLDEDARDAA
jgi:hypothetical protein